MFLEKLGLNNFRSFERAEIPLDSFRIVALPSRMSAISSATRSAASRITSSIWT